jgi:hypothetical protein
MWRLRACVLGLAFVACARTVRRPSPAFQPGTFWFERRSADPQSLTFHTVLLVLDDRGGARATMRDQFTFEARSEGELSRDDEDTVELVGRWSRGWDDRLAMTLDPVHGADDQWRLRCVVPARSEAVLACERVGADVPPKFATQLRGKTLLLLGRQL